MRRNHSSDNHNVPRKVWPNLTESSRSCVTKFAEVIRKRIGIAYMQKDNSEIDIPRLGQIISMKLHASKYISIFVIGMLHYLLVSALRIE